MHCSRYHHGALRCATTQRQFAQVEPARCGEPLAVDRFPGISCIGVSAA
ncbi:hypothetical protein [Nostoc sp. FACHB-145]|nr:hypothetical protein [Nostoc sp. FACHB-145]MBD2468395.1 hypothetical protein [Nostoc sp. FACHB-145]